KHRIAGETSLANYSFYLGATNDNIDEITKINPHRVCGVKVFIVRIFQGGEKSVARCQETVVGRGSEAKQEKRKRRREETTKHSKGAKNKQMEREGTAGEGTTNQTNGTNGGKQQPGEAERKLRNTRKARKRNKWKEGEQPGSDLPGFWLINIAS
ncbi:MAG: hypothetical protein PHU50_03495, partial [Kiritimatiellae bacterium]|nr:hypothetical protein [Kiritimatiellia bacterium]